MWSGGMTNLERAEETGIAQDWRQQAAKSRPEGAASQVVVVRSVSGSWRGKDNQHASVVNALSMDRRTHVAFTASFPHPPAANAKKDEINRPRRTYSLRGTAPRAGSAQTHEIYGHRGAARRADGVFRRRPGRAILPHRHGGDRRHLFQ